MLNAFEHRIRLPPSDVVIVVKVGEVIGRMSQVSETRIANITRFLRSFGSSLNAKFTRSVLAARVGRLDNSVEGRVHEIRYASLQKNNKMKHYYI